MRGIVVYNIFWYVEKALAAEKDQLQTDLTASEARGASTGPFAKSIKDVRCKEKLSFCRIAETAVTLGVHVWFRPSQSKMIQKKTLSLKPTRWNVRY